MAPHYVLSLLCHIRGYVVRHNVIRYNVVQHYGAFRVMSYGKMLHSALYRIQTYVVQDCVVRHNVVQRKVVRPTVGVSNKRIKLEIFYIIRKFFYITYFIILLRYGNQFFEKIA